MKLRTEIEHVKTIVAGLPGDIWAHDALAAHALVQAMEDVGNHSDYRGNDAVIESIQKRADELMREWTNQSEV